MDVDRIDLPEDEIKERRPVYQEFALPSVYDGERFRTRLWWNSVGGRWFYDFIWVDYENPGAFGASEDTTRTVIPPTQAQLEQVTKFQDHFRVIFLDPSGQARRVRPGNLGETVEMTVWPGPDSPKYEPLADGREPWRRLFDHDPDIGERFDAPVPPFSGGSFGEDELDGNTFG